MALNVLCAVVLGTIMLTTAVHRLTIATILTIGTTILDSVLLLSLLNSSIDGFHI